MAITVRATPVVAAGEDEKQQTIRTDKRVLVETPAGQVIITYDTEAGALIVVKGEKTTTTVKFNNKAVV